MSLMNRQATPPAGGWPLAVPVGVSLGLELEGNEGLDSSRKYRLLQRQPEVVPHSKET
jgi:hypothetical protein